MHDGRGLKERGDRFKRPGSRTGTTGAGLKGRSNGANDHSTNQSERRTRHADTGTGKPIGMKADHDEHLL